MNFKKAGILIIMDILLLAELSFSIYKAHFDMSSVAWIFCKHFIPLAMITIVLTVFAVKRWASDKNHGGDARIYRPVGIVGPIGERYPGERAKAEA